MLLKDLYDLRQKSGNYRPQHIKLELQIEEWLSSAEKLAASLEYACDRFYKYIFNNPNTTLGCPTLIMDHKNGEYYHFKTHEALSIKKALQECRGVEINEKANVEDALDAFYYTMLDEFEHY